MSNYLGFDISAWQGRPSRQWFRDLRQAGFAVAIIQLWGSGPGGNGPNPDAGYQLQTALEEGFDTHGYLWIPSGPTETDQLVASAAGAAGAEFAHVRYLWPDVEAQPVGPERMQNAIANCEAQGRQVGIYTSKSAFPLIGGNFSARPLWDAAWFYNSGILPLLSEWPADPGNAGYGGWTGRAIRQFAGDVNLFGGKLDLNIVNYDSLGLSIGVTPIPNPTKEDLTVGQYEDLVNRINGLAGALNAHIASPHSQATPPVPVPGPGPQRTHTVQPGETLGGIAQQYTGNASRWPEIPDIPPAVRADPRKLQVGTVLTIPW